MTSKQQRAFGFGAGIVSVACAVFAIGAASRGDDEAATPAATTTAPIASAADAVAVDIAGFKFVPKEIEVAAGTSISWTNEDKFAHSIRSEDGTFDSTKLAQGQSFSAVFSQPGTYSYICGVHNSMKGTVVVTP